MPALLRGRRPERRMCRPSGFIAPATRLTVPSLPPQSIACSTSSTRRPAGRVDLRVGEEHLLLGGQLRADRLDLVAGPGLADRLPVVPTCRAGPGVDARIDRGEIDRSSGLARTATRSKLPHLGHAADHRPRVPARGCAGCRLADAGQDARRGDNGAACETWRREFEAERDHLTAVAYRMLGSRAEAEDAVQEAWLRYAGRCRPGGPRRDPRPARLADHDDRAGSASTCCARPGCAARRTPVSGCRSRW